MFDSCQLTITWMSTIKLNRDCICLGHLTCNALSLQENNQSEHVYYYSHIIINCHEVLNLSPLILIFYQSTVTLFIFSAISEEEKSYMKQNLILSFDEPVNQVNILVQ